MNLRALIREIIRMYRLQGFKGILADISRNNLKIFRQDLLECNNIEIVRQDASLYSFADECSLVYFNNPFRLNIFREVVEKLALNKALSIIVYYNLINDNSCVALSGKPYPVH